MLHLVIYFQVIVQLAKHLKWSYIIGLATSDNYGRKGMAELMRLAKEQMICVSLIQDFDLFDESQMETFVRTTLDKQMENIKGIIGNFVLSICIWKTIVLLFNYHCWNVASANNELATIIFSLVFLLQLS